MTKFESPSFSVGVGDTQAYRDNWERIFGKNKPEEPKKMDELPAPREAQEAPKPVKKKKQKQKKKKSKKEDVKAVDKDSNSDTLAGRSYDYDRDI